TLCSFSPSDNAITGNSVIGVNSGTFNPSNKRNQKEDFEKNGQTTPIKRKKIDDYFPVHPPNYNDDISKSQKTRVGNVLPDGTVLSNPPPQPDFTARNYEEEFPALVDEDEEENPPFDNIIKCVPATAEKWETYEETSNMLDKLDHGYNKLEYIFKKTDHVKRSHYKSNFISEPWWTPKKNITSQLSTAIKEMDEKN
ncbi:4897_t:CDS:2, partial [Funneliformis geosporum]